MEQHEVIAAVIVVAIPSWIGATRQILAALYDVGHLPAWLGKYDRSRAERIVANEAREEALTALAERYDQIIALLTKPNGGSSVPDQVASLKLELAHVATLLQQHIDYARTADSAVLARLEEGAHEFVALGSRVARLEAERIAEENPQGWGSEGARA